MRAKTLISTILSLKTLQVGCHVNNATDRNATRKRTFECNLCEVDGIPEKDTLSSAYHEHSQISCINENDGLAYFFRNFSPNELSDFLMTEETTSSSRLQIEFKDETKIVEGILDKADIKRIHQSRSRWRKRNRRRKLYNTKEGTRRVLVIRVTSNEDFSPTYNSSVISDRVFGTFGETNNLRLGYNACSAGKLDMAPAQGPNIDNGVMELRISQNVTNVKWKMVQNYVINTLGGHNISTIDYDNVMMVLPPQVDFEGAAAWAFLSFNIAIFKDTYIRYQLVLMHELGHNLGYHHSGNSVSRYGDDSCFMGGQVWGSSRICFNAAKSWYSGWYSDRHLMVEPIDKAWSGDLVGIDDYVSNMIVGGDRQIVLKIIGINQTDTFAMFNRIKDINEDIIGSQNKVTIVQQERENTPSILLGALRDGDIYRAPNWGGSGNDLVIQDCGHVKEGFPWGNVSHAGVDYARVRVFVDDGKCNLQCNQTLHKCVENSNDRFFLRIDEYGNAISRKCKWLSERRLTRKKQLCRRVGEGRGQYKAARHTCCNTCGVI